MNYQFTIVIPTRNGGEYLKTCLNSLLAQTFDNFEIAILENCSNDGSAEWLSLLRDSRVRIYPATKPLSIEDNWARAVEIPKKEFVTFLGDDDLFDLNYLEVMSHLIADNPSAGLYHCHFRFINSEGKRIGPCRIMPARETAGQFLKAFFRSERNANGTGYIMRSRDFDQVGGFPHFRKMLYADHALWLKMVSNSFIVTASQECFSYRLHKVSTSASARWRDHLQAIQQFIFFLKQFEERDSELSNVIQKYAPLYFFTVCKNYYMNAVVEATNQNLRVQPGVRKEFAAVLKEIAPQELEKFRKSKIIRFRIFINRYAMTRIVYNIYILARHKKRNLVFGR